MGQEPADADDPARRGVHLERRYDRGAARRGRRAGAHGRGARRSASARPLRDRRSSSASLASMLLAIDVGNTQTVFGLFDGDRLTEQFRVGTDRRTRATSSRSCCARSSTSSRSTASCSASSVPQLVREYETFAERWAGIELLVLGPGVSTGVPIRYDDPREVGPDRIANAVAARERHGAPAVVVDFGTSTNFDVVSAAGEFAGGVLAPGIEISMDALFARAARLPKVPFAAPEHVISQTTDGCAAVGPRLRLRRPGRRDRRRASSPSSAPRRAGRRDRRPRRSDRTALVDDHRRRSRADAAGPPARLGAQPDVRTLAHPADCSENSCQGAPLRCEFQQ